MSTVYCFQCGREYVEDVSVCVECGVPLVDTKPTPIEEVGTQDEAQVAYELFEWSFEARAALDRALTEQGVQHGWQGAVLIVRELDEDQVDAMAEEVEASADDRPQLDPDADRIGYALDDWSDDARGALTATLELNGVAYEIDEDGELLVAEDDEETVDKIFDALTERFAMEEELGEAEIDMEGLQLNDFLSDVRVLAQKLAKNPGDAKATISIVDKASTLAVVRTPFGFDSRLWASIRKGAADMAGVLRSEHRTEEEVTDAAANLRGLLENVI